MLYKAFPDIWTNFCPGPKIRNYNLVSRNSWPSIRKQMYECTKIKFAANMQQMIQNVFLLKSCALEKEKLKRNSLEVKKNLFLIFCCCSNIIQSEFEKFRLGEEDHSNYEPLELNLKWPYNIIQFKGNFFSDQNPNQFHTFIIRSIDSNFWTFSWWRRLSIFYRRNGVFIFPGIFWSKIFRFLGIIKIIIFCITCIVFKTRFFFVCWNRINWRKILKFVKF